MAIAMAEAPTPNLLAISAIEIPICRHKNQAISARTFDTLLLSVEIGNVWKIKSAV
jgi:hypothetical protein